MASNKQQVLVGTIESPFVTLPATSQNTALDGTGTLGTSVFSLFTADATNGSNVGQVVATHLGTNVASVIRIFINNGSTNGTAANNELVGEIAMAANTVSQTAISVQGILDFGVLGLNLKAGYRLLATYGTSVAAGYALHCRGAGDFT
jgi:hypothetical protein